MPSFAYIDQLRSQLEADQLTWEDVLDRLHRSKPWTKADWKTRRAALLGSSCGTCGSTQPPLVLQHVWHPAPFGEQCEIVKTHLLHTSGYLEQHPYPPEPLPFDPASAPLQPVEPRNACPKCNSINVRQSKDGQWKCNFIGKPRACRHQFETPVIRQYRKFDDAAWLSHLDSKHRWETGQLRRQWWQAFMDAFKPTILKSAAALSLEEHRRYVELRPEDVVTRCKKCAFLEDKAFTQDYAYGVYQERQRTGAAASEPGDI